MPVYANSLPPSSLDAGAVQNVWVTGDGNLTSGTKTQRVALVATFSACPLPPSPRSKRAAIPCSAIGSIATTCSHSSFSPTIRTTTIAG